LQERLWPATFVHETNLATLIAEVRRALKDAASTPAFIRTMYGFGYRFVANVTEAHAPARRGGARGRPILVVDGRQVTLAEDESVIGRAEDAAVRVDAAGVSRRHARVVVADGAATVEDLGSKNGTYIGAELVTTPRLLADGDEIRIGPVTLTFRTRLVSSTTETVVPPRSGRSGPASGRV
jgi:hypothetical protein